MESGVGRIDSRPLTAVEEAVKRNTDCVYFLASPLTCKKGNECEYRHSEGARVNPRDCRYWLNGNCLNPKCSFRHLPLDSLFGTPGTTTSEPAPPPSQTVASTQIPVAHAPVYNFNKPSVPCIYFQKGHCLKGNRCPFMHGPQPTGNPVPQQMAKVSTSLTEQPQTFKDSQGIKEYTSQQNILPQQNISKMTVDRPVAVPLSSVKPVSRAESSPSNGLSHKKSLVPYPSGNKLPRSQPTHAPVNNGGSLSRHPHYQMHPLDECLQNGRESGEFLRESSSGFDVVIGDTIKDNGCLHNEDDLGRALVRGGRNLDSANDYDQHSGYEPVLRFERDQYNGTGNGVGEFEQHRRMHNFNALEPHRTSSERILDRPLLPGRRLLQRRKSPDEVVMSDLRHQLLKQRRLNGSRSAVSPDRGEPHVRNDRHMGDRYLGHYSRRDELQFPLENSVSNRLRGRISLPRRSPPDVPLSLLSEKERDRAGHQGRVSPSRPVSYQGRHHDRIRRRPSEDPHCTADARNFGGQLIKRDDADSLKFAGPKSLAELKGMKVVESSQGQSSKSISVTIPLEQNGKVAGSQESERSLSFEDPKLLSVNLKRKREAEPGKGSISSSGYENNQRNGAISSLGESNKEDIHTVSSHEEPVVRTVGGGGGGEEGLIPAEDEELVYDGQSSPKGRATPTEDYMVVDTMEDQEQQNSYQGDGDSEEDMDDEDDFARKVGVIFS